MIGRGRPVLVAAVLLGATVMPLAPGVSTALRPARHPRVISVVAAEDTWGSLASQLGGRLVVVTSIITNPNADPHEYEASTAVARSIGGANFVIVNGAGYDDWAQKILAANPAPHRFVLDIAKFLDKKPGDNPHFWYDPKYVFAVIDRISADYTAVDPAGAGYFRQCLAKVESSLVPYRKALASLARHDAGVKVASTEEHLPVSGRIPRSRPRHAVPVHAGGVRRLRPPRWRGGDLRAPDQRARFPCTRLQQPDRHGSHDGDP